MAYEDQYQQVLSPKYDCLLFDVDDTLYPLSSGLAKEVTNNIEDYMVQKLGIDENKVHETNYMLYKNYGTSMAGLKAIGYDFDNDEYHSFAHGRLPYEKLKPDPVLRNLLFSLPVRKIIFSNGDKAHVTRVLNKLGLEDCFEGIICFESLNPEVGGFRPSSTSSSKKTIDFIDHPCEQERPNSVLPETPIVCKPFEEAYEQAFKLANIDPQRTVFFDDSTRNILTGKRLGLKTVLVGTSNRTNGADYAVDSIHSMKEALVDMWETKQKSETISYGGKVAIETTVRA